MALPCLSPNELIVTVSRGRSTATLAVPGATSSRPFSVLASAEVDLGGTEVVLAVTHTSAAVRTVISEFPGGGKDSTAPVEGWSVLVHRPAGREATSTAGAVTLVASIGHRLGPRAGEAACHGFAGHARRRHMPVLDGGADARRLATGQLTTTILAWCIAHDHRQAQLTGRPLITTRPIGREQRRSQRRGADCLH